MEYTDAELTKQIIKIMFEVFNYKGWGYREKYYQTAIVIEAQNRGIPVSTEFSVPLFYKGKPAGRRRVDLVFFERILVELKVGDRLTRKDFDQLNEYLKSLNKEIGLLVLFSPKGVYPRRLANIQK